MSDSEDDHDEGGVSLAGFLFGNIDMKTGQLEDDILDSESKRQLSALQKFGLASIMNDVMEGQQKEKEEEANSRKRRRLYDSDSDSDDEDEEEEVEFPARKRNSSANSQSEEKSCPEDENYDEAKSPSAVDFSDINELAAEEEIVSALSSAAKENEDDTDYDDSSSESDQSEKHVRRLFTERDDKYLMPPPLTTHIKKTVAFGESTTPTKDSTSPSTSPTKSPNSGTSGLAAGDSSADKKLETPLAAMMPSKYEGVNVCAIFPEFRPGKVLRWSRLFVPVKPNSLPQIWKNVKRRRKKRKMLMDGQTTVDASEDTEREKRGWAFQFAEDLPASMVAQEDEELFLSDSLDKPKTDLQKNLHSEGRNSTSASIWRHGPAELWFDMLNVPEDVENFDYGIQAPSKASEEEETDEVSDDADEATGDKENQQLSTVDAAFSGDAFQMLTQRDWEADIVWDGSDPKYKKLTKNTAAGWVPSGGNRTAQTFSQPGVKGAPGSGTGSSNQIGGSGMKKDGKDELELALIKTVQKLQGIYRSPSPLRITDCIDPNYRVDWDYWDNCNLIVDESQLLAEFQISLESNEAASKETVNNDSENVTLFQSPPTIETVNDDDSDIEILSQSPPTNGVVNDGDDSEIEILPQSPPNYETGNSDSDSDSEVEILSPNKTVDSDSENVTLTQSPPIFKPLYEDEPDSLDSMDSYVGGIGIALRN